VIYGGWSAARNAARARRFAAGRTSKASEPKSVVPARGAKRKTLSPISAERLRPRRFRRLGRDPDEIGHLMTRPSELPLGVAAGLAHGERGGFVERQLAALSRNV
jgi:hypothetical protein